ncbi:hypothetical protein [Lysobacter claricitrinus]|uniref:hypothetical protein n=1 Tax=Lysobacter claricitrinus TaxID=3367728 RepID=UPI0037DAD4C0
MSEPVPPRPPLPPNPFGRWRHDLSNEINALTMATAAARHMIEMGDLQAAMANLARAEDSGQRCIELLHLGPPPG